MAYSIVQHTATGFHVATLTSGSNITSGNAVLVAVASSASTVPTVTGSLNGVYAQVGSTYNWVAGPAWTSLFWKASSAGGAKETITLSIASTAVFDLWLVEVSGFPGSPPVFDVQANAAGTASPASVTIAPHGADLILTIELINAGTSGALTNLTLLDNLNDFDFWWTTAGAGSVTQTNVGITAWSMSAFAFQPTINFGGTAQPKISCPTTPLSVTRHPAGSGSPAINSSGAITVSRQIAGTASPGSNSSGAITVSRRPAGTGSPLVSASGSLIVTPPPLQTLRVKASGSITVPISAVAFAGTATPAISASGALLVNRSNFTGTARPSILATGSLLVINPKTFNGQASPAILAYGILTVPFRHPVIVGVTGLYVVETDWNTYGVWTLVAGVDYEYALQTVESGPFPDYGSALAYIETNFFAF